MTKIVHSTDINNDQEDGFHNVHEFANTYTVNSFLFDHHRDRIDALAESTPYEINKKPEFQELVSILSARYKKNPSLDYLGKLAEIAVLRAKIKQLEEAAMDDEL